MRTSQARGPRGSIPACAGEPTGLPILPVRPGVYPRVCGGTGYCRFRRTIGAGLSPRVRGNHLPFHGCLLHGRSIPACAGEPISPRSASASATVYPRVCGGTISMQAGRVDEGGLSPRVRGNRSAAPSTYMATRSIPACAGEPSYSSRTPGQRRVYPRVCGGTHLVQSLTYEAGGLSPRVRGNLPVEADNPLGMRSIPACAGEPNNTSPGISAHQVYPRVCGGTWRLSRESR